MSEFSIQSLTGGVNSHAIAGKILSMLKNHPILIGEKLNASFHTSIENLRFSICSGMEHS